MIATTARRAGCACGGCLHSSNYARKPRGGPANLPDDICLRLSFCCAEVGCRRRTTPPSVRLLGRKVYFGAVVVLVTAMQQGSSPRRIAELRRHFGVSWKTVDRWRRYWLESFAQSPFWRSARGRLAQTVTELPRSLWQQFGELGESSLVAMLRYISPVTTASGTQLMAAL